ncbi:hypothetical protein [Brevundimonas sp.]|uniref:hypothetical protein n=1 Tax=Brevundimonas sp. TaxID=1871086 RepID=UPI002EDB4347
MQRRDLLGLILAGPLVGAAAPGCSRASPRPLEDENIDVADSAWIRLSALRREPKFQPHDYPPLGYMGPDTPEDLEPLTNMVNRAIDRVLALKAPRISAASVRPVLLRTMAEAALFATDDRDRVVGYLLEVWYILGFHTALFAMRHGSAYKIPPGYSEPLPPGWTTPDRPRPIG